MSDASFLPEAQPDRVFLRTFGWIPPRVIERTLTATLLASLPTNLQERQRWLLYAAMQTIVASEDRDAVGQGAEDRLDEYLDIILDGSAPDDLTEVGPWLKYIPANREKKHARRRELQHRFRHDLRRPGFAAPDADAETSDDLMMVEMRVNEDEWRLLWRAAHHDLSTLARADSIPLGTLKARLSRCRARVRLAC